MQHISLPDALHKRAGLVAHYMTRNLSNAGAWTGYTKDEPLMGELRRDNMIAYWRREHPHAKLDFWNPVLTDIVKMERGDPKILQENAVERFVDDLEIPEGTTFNDVISYTFSKTTTLSQALKIGMEATTKLTAGASVSGVNVSAEVGLKIYGEYSRQWGESETRSNTESKTLSVVGPKSLTYEAIRSLNKESVHIKALSDMSFGIHFLDDTHAGGPTPPDWEFGADWSEFLKATQGLASSENEFYHVFEGRHLSDEEYAELSAAPDCWLEYDITYQNVTHQDIIVKDK